MFAMFGECMIDDIMIMIILQVWIWVYFKQIYASSSADRTQNR